MTASNDKGQQINLSPVFSELYASVQSLLTVLYQMRSMTQVNEEGGLGLQLSQLDAARSAQRRAYGELSRLRRAVSQSRDRLDALVSEASTLKDSVQTLKENSSETRNLREVQLSRSAYFPKSRKLRAEWKRSRRKPSDSATGRGKFSERRLCLVFRNLSHERLRAQSDS